MAFHTFRFLLLFLPIVVAVYRLLYRRSGQFAAHSFLLAASAFFYAWSGWGSALSLAFSILMNYWLAHRIANQQEDGPWLRAGVLANVAWLCYFKYGALGGPWLGASKGWSPGFPLGVSFFTVQQIMYLVDVSERMYPPGKLFDHALAVSYFPYVTAGPITRMREMFKQLQPAPLSDASDLQVGLFRLAIGLFKKAVLADSIGLVVDAGYGQAASLSMTEAWLSAALYLLQLYLDFSGYCDMAIGAARMLGHTIPENFNHPMTATSITEFWQRWHMTLTSFITTYLYTPMIRSMGKVTKYKAMAATVGVMIVAGAWHGSGLPFVLFGLLHGIALATHLYWRGSKRKMSNAAGRFITFLFVIFAFLFFRSPNLATLRQMLAASVNAHAVVPWSLATLKPALISNWRITTLICVLSPFLCFLGRPASEYVKQCRWSPALACGVALLLFTSLVFLNSIPDKGFIYAGF